MNKYIGAYGLVNKKDCMGVAKIYVVNIFHLINFLQKDYNFLGLICLHIMPIMYFVRLNFMQLLLMNTIITIILNTIH